MDLDIGQDPVQEVDPLQVIPALEQVVVPLVEGGEGRRRLGLEFGFGADLGEEEVGERGDLWREGGREGGKEGRKM